MKRVVSIALMVTFVLCGILAFQLFGEQVEKQAVTAMEQFQLELQKLKPKLDGLPAEELDRHVRELQNRIVPTPGWWEPRLEEPANALEVLERQNLYLERLRASKDELDKLKPEEKLKRMERIKKEIFQEEIEEAK